MKRTQNKSVLTIDPCYPIEYNRGMNDTNMTRCAYCGMRMPLSHISPKIIAPWMVLCTPCTDKLNFQKSLDKLTAIR